MTHFVTDSKSPGTYTSDVTPITNPTTTDETTATVIFMMNPSAWDVLDGGMSSVDVLEYVVGARIILQGSDHVVGKFQDRVISNLREFYDYQLLLHKQSCCYANGDADSKSDLDAVFISKLLGVSQFDLHDEPFKYGGGEDVKDKA